LTVAFENLENDLRAILETLATQDYGVSELIFAPPATAAEVLAVEAELGLTLPAALRRMLTTITGDLDMNWWKPDDWDYSAPFEAIFCGQLHWSLTELSRLESERQGWIDTCFPDAKAPYDRIWHDKLAFHSVGNGDMMAIDLSPKHAGKVVYLSHDDGLGHGMFLAPSFDAFVERYLAIACPGGEDQQWLPFLNADGGGLDGDGDNACAWRQILNLEA
jgi:cell wall assembly regulator SMI1